MDSYPASGAASAIDEYPIEKDLASVACRAAIELDNHLLNRGKELGAISTLHKLVSESLPTGHDPMAANWLRDPSAAVVINRALRQGTHTTQVDELVKQAHELLNQFSSLLENPKEFVKQRRSDAEKMREFCLALSRSAASTRRSPLDRNEGSVFRR